MSKTITKEQAKAYFDSWREVYKNKNLKGLDLPVLMLIKDTNFEDFYVSQGKLSQDICCERKAVNEALKSLIACGYLIRTDNFKQGSHKPHHYKLNSNLVSPSKDTFSHESEGLHDMSPNGHMKKNKVEPVMSPNGHTNVFNEKDLTHSVESENKISSEDDDTSLTEDTKISTAPTSAYSKENPKLSQDGQVLAVFTFGKECRPTDQMRLSEPLAQKIYSFITNQGEEKVREALRKWGGSNLYMTIDKVFANDNNFRMCLSQKPKGIASMKEE